MPDKRPTNLSRPYMPGYGIQGPQEGDGLLPWTFVTERMAASHNYWINTTRPDGRPHATPVWGLWFDGRFYFSAGHNSRKARNLAADPRLIVHLESGDEVVIFEGQVEMLSPDESLFSQLDAAYHDKYNFHLMRDEPLYLF